MKRALLVVFGAALGLAIFVALLPLGERLGWLRDLSPPPHFKPLSGADGRTLTDARGRALFAIDPSSAAQVGKAQVDRRWCAREKDAGALRVLSVGESTTFGVGYAGVASYSRFLEARLRRLLGRDDVEVVNCGKNGNDSHDWPTLAPELLVFAPDLIVVYVGHNELKKPNLIGVVDPAKARLRRSQLLRRLLGEPIDELATPPPLQAGPLLTPAQRAFALELFDDGLRALLEVARDQRIPLLLCIPASNVLDSPPRLSTLRPDAGAARLAEASAAGLAYESGPLPDFGASGAAGLGAAKDALVAELARVERALAADPDAAILHFRRARMLLSLRRVDEAKAAFGRSLALDGLPERASPDVIDATRALARDFGVAVADVEARFGREAALGVPGNDLFIDYCHPNLWGHFLIADEIVHALIEHDLLAPRAAFDRARESGGTLRERFAALAAELGVSEVRAAAFQVEQAKLQVGNLGTRERTTPRDWKVPEEFLHAALRQDPQLERNAEFLVLLAICRSGAGDGEEARRRFAAAADLDGAGCAALASRIRQLPGIVGVLAAIGVTADDHGFHW